jgi:enediyne biosynthesis protein E4
MAKIVRPLDAIPVSAVLLLIGAAVSSPARAAGGAACPAPIFREVTDEAGIHFVHHKPVFDPKLENIMPWMSSINAGIAVADYDWDGLPDIYLLNSRQSFPNALFRNLGDFKFVEVGRKAGLANVNDESGVSMDAYFADVDNNGTEDLVLAQYGRTRLFLNQRGHFTEVGKQAGVAPVGNAAAIAVFDYDNDGWLDIMIGNYYADFDLWHLTTTKILQTNFQNARNGGRKLLYHNNHNGTFTEVSKQAGITDTGWTLDIGTGDLQNHGLMDVYLANDFGTDVVYRNNGDGTFTDVTLEATGGDNFGGMNAEIADYNDDGWLDVYVTNITDEFLQQGNMLWQNQGSMVFSNVGQDTGTANGGWGWGGKFFDLDNDGRLDLLTVNGFVSDGPLDIFRFPGVLNSADVSDASLWPDMRGVSMSGYEKKRLFHNEGDHFREMAQSAGFTSLLDGRGVAIADFDGDGALDVAVSNCGAGPLLYRNEISPEQPWLEVELRGTASNRDAIGARVTLVAGGQRQTREIDGGNGFSAQSWRVLHFGLGASQAADELQVRWPSGKRQVFKDVPARSRLLIVEPAS